MVDYCAKKLKKIKISQKGIFILLRHKDKKKKDVLFGWSNHLRKMPVL
jgi:hypothetical protein